MIEKTPLDCKYPVGNGVAKPEYKNGPTTIISTKTADMTGRKVSATEYDHTNLSAKWKKGTQDIPAAARHQYQ